LETSAICVETETPRDSIIFAVSPNSFSFTSETAIAPIFSRAKRTANARPMPEAAPVITATLLFDKVINFKK
jgi:hypothetical protein